MKKTLSMACKASKLQGKCLQLLNHNIIICSIVAGHAQYLQVSSVTPVIIGMNLFNATFSVNLKSSRTPANAVAISRLVWDWHHVSAHAQHNLVCVSLTFATSTMSNSIDRGTPLCSKWMENAINALWLGDVQASIMKLNFLSYFW